MSKLLNGVEQVIDFTLEELQKDPNYTGLEIGDEVVTVFKNGILILSMEEDECGRSLKSKFIMDEPFFMDYTLDL